MSSNRPIRDKTKRKRKYDEIDSDDKNTEASRILEIGKKKEKGKNKSMPKNPAIMNLNLKRQCPDMFQIHFTRNEPGPSGTAKNQ